MDAIAAHVDAWTAIGPAVICWAFAIWAVIVTNKRPAMTALQCTSPDVVHRVVASARRQARALILAFLAIVAIMVALPFMRVFAIAFVGYVLIPIPTWWRASRLNRWLDAPDAVCLLGRSDVIVTRGSQTRWLRLRSDIIARCAVRTIPSAQIAPR